MGCAHPRRPVARLSFLLISVLPSVAPRTARAQQLGGTFPVEERQTAVARVVPGEFVRARLTDGSRAGGPLVDATPVTFTLGPSVAYSDNQYIVRLVNVDSLWVRAYSSRRGAMIGGGVGGLLGLGLGMGVHGSICPTSSVTKACAQGAVSSAAVGVLLGGVTGSIVGSGIGHWRRLLPRRGWSPEPSGSRVARLIVPDDSATFDKRALALMRVRPDAIVRLTFADRGDLSGYVVRAGARGASIGVIAGNAPDEPIAITSLEAIWERGHAGKTGAAIGTLLGALGGGVVYATQSSACDPHRNCRMAIIGDGVGGALLGLFAGDRVGRFFPHWQRRF